MPSDGVKALSTEGCLLWNVVIIALCC